MNFTNFIAFCCGSWHISTTSFDILDINILYTRVRKKCDTLVLINGKRKFGIFLLYLLHNRVLKHTLKLIQYIWILLMYPLCGEWHAL